MKATGRRFSVVLDSVKAKEKRHGSKMIRLLKKETEKNEGDRREQSRPRLDECSSSDGGCPER